MKTLFLGGTAALTLALPALAQEVTSPDEREIIIIKATKTEIDSFTYPGLTSLIDTETLDLIRPVDLDELLRGIPGVDISGGPRRTGQTLSLRGQGRANTTLLLDGARQNFDSAHDGAIFLDPSLLVSVETVRGPASALYGSGASGGVIAFRTATASDLLGPDDSWGFHLGAGYRAVDEEERAIASVYGRQGPINALLSYSTRSAGDIELGSGDTLPAHDISQSLLANVGIDLADGINARLTWQSTDGKAIEPNNGQGIALAGSDNAEVVKAIQNDNLTLGFDIAPADIGWLDANITLYSNQSGVNEDETGSTRQLRRDLSSEGLRVDQRFAYAFAEYQGGLTVGAEHYRDEQDGEDNTQPGDVRGGAPDAKSEFSAAFAQLEIEGPAPFGLPGEIILLPGLRYDAFDNFSDLSTDTSNDATSGRLGFTYAPTDTLNFFVNWAEAFRAPSINELYIDGTHFSLPHIALGAPVVITNEFIANPELRPEQTETLEFGVSLDMADKFNVDRFTLRTAWYETEAEDLIDLFVDYSFDDSCFAPPFFLPCSAGTTQSRNISAAELSGYEAQLAFAQGEFSLDASLSGIDGRNLETGETLGTLTPTRVFLDGRYRLDTSRLTLGSRIEWSASFDAPDDVAQHRDDYTVVDFYARWQPWADSGLTLNTGIDNAFDADYERVFAGVSEPGRSLRLDIGWSRNF